LRSSERDCAVSDMLGNRTVATKLSADHSEREI